jgi:FkbM family methyltransferase
VSFVSYAQNFEDVMLRRAFRDVEAGFYVDVGAWEPDIDSVTKALYESGWHGINIEPGPVFPRLAQGRPRDINLQLALGAEEGRRTLHVHHADTTVLGTSTLRTKAASETQQGDLRVESCEVEVRTLAQVLDTHAGGRHIHFLKIDAEGAEREIIQGADWQRHRPELLVIEATRPNSTDRNDAAWSPLLAAAGYRAVWFDGLNAWFLREESMARAAAFQVPPNVFDDFRVHDQETAQKLAQSEAWGRSLEAAILRGQEKFRQAREEGTKREEIWAEREKLLAQDDAVPDARGQLIDHHQMAQELARAEARARSLEAVVLSVQEELRRVQEAPALAQDRDAAYAAVIAEHRALLEARWRLIHRLEMPDGPCLLRIVLPALRVVRRIMRRGRGPDTLPADVLGPAPLLATPAHNVPDGRLARSIENALITLAMRSGQGRS